MEKIKINKNCYEQIYDDLPLTGYPKDYLLTSSHQYLPSTEDYQFCSDSYSRLMKLSHNSNYALFVILFSGVAYSLGAFNLLDEVAIGIPEFKESSQNKYEKISVVKSNLELSRTYKDFLLQTKRDISDADKNHTYLLKMIVENPDLNHSMFKTFVMLENIHNRQIINIIKPDIAILFSIQDSSLYMKIVFNTLIYKRDSIIQILNFTASFYDCVKDQPEILLSDIDILSKEDKYKLVYEFNNNKTDYQKDATISQLFEGQVKLTPYSQIIFEDIKITFDELNKKANKLAGMLRTRSVKSNEVIGIIMDRSIDMIVAIVAVLKAGCAYLPIDPSFPQERVLTMLNDSNVTVIVSNLALIEPFNFFSLSQRISGTITPIVTNRRPQISDFNSIPLPDRSLIDYEKYHRFIGMGMSKNAIGIMASRGCPYNCAYCHKIWPKRQIMRSAEHIFSEIKMYYDIGIRRFIFIDDIFNLDLEISSRFFNMIVDSKIQIQILFPTGVRGDILTESYIDLMIKAGVVNISLALETASPRLQKLIGKNLNLDKLKKNIDYITNTYPHVILELFSMHGFPTETKEEALATLNFIKDIKWVHFPYFHLLKIYPGTDMEKIALANGISKEEIDNSVELAFHQLPETLPFDKSFTQKCQNDFLTEYFMSKERLLKVLPYQTKVFTEDELVQKYNSYLPIEVRSFLDILNFAGIDYSELGKFTFLNDNYGFVPNFNDKVKCCFPQKQESPSALRILLLDLSQYFSSDTDMLYDVVEAPLGLMYLLTYLNEKLGDKLSGKIAKSRIDFDSYDELTQLIQEYKPDIIGIRTLTFYRSFLHKTVSLIRQWGIGVPIISGGPYATSDFTSVLKDKNIDLVVIGEGEITLCELIEAMLDNDKKLPSQENLMKIGGLAFVDNKEKHDNKILNRDIILTEQINLELYDDKDIVCVNCSDDLAYVMYTSGTTGTPKGIMIPHYSVSRVIKNTNYINISSSDVLLQLSNYAFDGSIFDIFGALLNGASLVLLRKETLLDMNILSSIITNNNVSVFFVTTALFNTLIDTNVDCIRNLRKLLFGGESVSLEHVKKAFTMLGKGKIIHMYGPTESTVFATSYMVNDVDDRCATIPIGKPISNTDIYIMNYTGKLQPIGALGEIYISGDGLSKGYINNKVLTSDKYLIFSNLDNKLLYKTGDIGRWLPDGNIEFWRRADTQIKIRGFRIELEEIENLLLKHKAINNAIVTLHEDTQKNKSLRGYVVLKEEVTSAELKEYLNKFLPSFMIPSHIIFMDQLPLNQNGKIDINLLAGFDLFSSNTSEIHQEIDETDRRLLELFSEVFGNEHISINDNILELGGSSLQTTLLAIKLQQEFNVDVSLRDVYEKQTIRDISELIKNKIVALNPSIDMKQGNEMIILVKGNKDENKKNIFFIHDGSGEIEGYIGFIRMLNDNFNYWAIRAKRYSSFAPQNLRLDDISKQYVSEIRGIQAEGPYYIAGWSLGGSIAFEIIRQLNTKGEKRNVCVMFDTNLIIDTIPNALLSFEKEDEINLISNIINSDYDLITKLSTLDSIEQYWTITIEYIENNDLSMGVIETIRSLMPVEILNILPVQCNSSLRELIYYINLARSFVKAQNTFLKPASSLNAEFFYLKASENPVENIKKHFFLVENEITFNDLYGNHYSIFSGSNIQPNAQIFSDILNRFID